jgi:hypothetical protein
VPTIFRATIGDLNADGRLDIVAAAVGTSNNVGIFLQSSPQTLTITSANTMIVDGTLTVTTTTTAVGGGGSLNYNIINGSGSAIVDSNGLITAISAGDVTLTVNISGDTDYQGTSTDQLITISKGTPTLIFNSSNALAMGDSLTASVSSTATYARGGAITFSISAGSGSATVDETTGYLTATGAGTVILMAMSAGDNDYHSVIQSQTITITKETPTLTITSSNSMLVDDAFTATVTTTATVSSGGALTFSITAGSGSATVNSNTGFINAIGAGTVTLNVSSAGDTNYYSNSTSQEITIGMTTPTFTIASTNTLSVDESITVSTTAGHDIGTLSYSIFNGTGSAFVDTNGILTAISAGDLTLTVTSAGNSDYNGTSVDQLIIVTKGTPALSIISANTVALGANLQAVTTTTATYGRGGAVTFSITAGSGSATVDTNTGLITTISAGSVTLTAMSAGDADYNPATANQLITIQKATPTLTITSSNTLPVDDILTATVTTTATVSSGGAITFSITAGSGSATVNTNTGLITGISIGTVTLTASSAGDVNYYSATTSQLITIGQATPTLTITSANSISVGDSMTATVNTTATGGRGGAITFSITNGTGSASVNSTTGFITANSIGTVTLTVGSAGDANYHPASASQLITIASNIPTTISSFSPASGPISTTVTINGTNFASTPSNNVVFFGAVQATVLTASPSVLTVKVPYGANYQHISVTRLSTNSTAYSAKPFIVTFSSNGTPNFANDGTLTVSGALLTYHMALGDLNGDGKPDLVVVDNNSGTSSATVGLDSPGNNNVYVFLNTSSPSGVISYVLNSTLTLPFNYGPAYEPGYIAALSIPGIRDYVSDGSNNVAGVAIKDMDGDGKPDVAITFKNERIDGIAVANGGSSCGNIIVTLNTYTTYSLAAFRNATANGSSSLTFNSPSLATFEGLANNSTNAPGQSVSTLSFAGGGFCDYFNVNSAATGDGNHRYIRNWYSSTIPASSQIHLPYGRNITLADFDGDGKPDVAIAKELTNTVSIYRNTSTSGTVSFATSQIFTVGSTSSYDLAAGDLDRDGKPDLIITNNGSANVTILKNNSTPGTLSFATAATLSVGTNPQALALGDFDGDGNLDLAVANNGANSVSLFRNTNATTGTISFPGTASLTLASGTNPFGLTLGDVDGDGKVDLAVENTGSSTVQVFKNITLGSSLSFTAGASYATGSSPQGVVMGDMNGDGKPDLAVTNAATGVSFLRNLITGPVAVITSFSPTSGPISTTVTISGTNFNATASRNAVFFGATQATVTGATSTSLTVIVPYGANYQYISVTNLDENTTAYSAKPFVVTYPTAVGGINDFASKIDLAVGSSPNESLVKDFNGDGKPDIIVANTSSNNCTVFFNTSTVGALSFTSSTLAVGSDVLGIAADDLDGDGRPDLILSTNSSTNVFVYRNTSTTSSIGFTYIGSPLIAGSTNEWTVLVGDVDLDGRPDIGVTNNAGANTISIFKNTSISGTISFASKVDFSTGTNPFGGVMGDFDGDGKVDLAITNQGKYCICVA